MLAARSAINSWPQKPGCKKCELTGMSTRLWRQNSVMWLLLILLLLLCVTLYWKHANGDGDNGGGGGSEIKYTSPLKERNSRLLVYAPKQLSSEGMLKTSLLVQNKKVNIYVYNQQDMISRSLIETHLWEPTQMRKTEALLNSDKELHYLDFGCNLGVYTLLAAKMGRKVVAVDANIENLKRLRRSLMDAQ